MGLDPENAMVRCAVYCVKTANHELFQEDLEIWDKAFSISLYENHRKCDSINCKPREADGWGFHYVALTSKRVVAVSSFAWPLTRLAERLRSEFGITVKALQLIQSYLSGRTQCIAIGGDISATHNCSTGIPQGSVLGSFLFSIYISPIADVIESFDVAQHQYADDANMYCALESKCDTITTDRI